MSFVVLLAAAAVVPAGQSFRCTPVRVWDGDGPVWCAEGPHVRLAGVAAREMDGTCRDNQPCPRVDPSSARDTLVQLVGSAVGWWGRRQSDSGLVCFSPWWRSVLRNDPKWGGAALGQILARP